MEEEIADRSPLLVVIPGQTSHCRWWDQLNGSGLASTLTLMVKVGLKFGWMESERPIVCDSYGWQVPSLPYLLPCVPCFTWVTTAQVKCTNVPFSSPSARLTSAQNTSEHEHTYDTKIEQSFQDKKPSRNRKADFCDLHPFSSQPYPAQTSAGSTKNYWSPQIWRIYCLNWYMIFIVDETPSVNTEWRTSNHLSMLRSHQCLHWQGYVTFRKWPRIDRTGERRETSWQRDKFDRQNETQSLIIDLFFIKNLRIYEFSPDIMWLRPGLTRFK